MKKSPDAFRSIGEVSKLVGVAPHVLRYWEGQFTQLSPVKRADGRRYYRPDDVRLVAGLCQVLREEGLSIRGAKRLISEDKGAALRQIGASRLGEPQSESQIAAVRLAIPDSYDGDRVVHAEVSASVAEQLAAPAIDAPAKRKRRSAEAQSDSLPLFPNLDLVPPSEWLGRLVATADALRARTHNTTAIPAGVKTLRDGLRAAR